MNGRANANAGAGESARAADRARAAMIRLLDRALGEDDLQEQTGRVAQPIEEARTEGACVLVFALGAEFLALPATDIVRVTPCVRPHAIPHRTNEIVRGLGNIGGELILCADLGALLDLPAADTAGPVEESTRRTIVLGDEAARWAFPVDRVIGVPHLDPDSAHAPPLTVEGAITSFTTSLIRVEGRSAARLDTERVLAGFERALT